MLVLAVVVLGPHGREHARRPLAAHRVHLAVHLLRPDGLGVQLVDAVLLLGANAGQGAGEDAGDGALAAAGGPHQHDAVAHQRGLVQLHDLEHPRVVVDEAQLLRLLLDGGSHVLVAALGRRRDGGEQVAQQGEEERHVLRHQLAQVHVAQRAVQQLRLRFLRVGPQDGARRAQHGQDVAQPKVVVLLLAQLLLAHVVQREELLGQQLVLDVADRRQLHLDDDLEVRHHHGHAAEQRLEVLRQLLPPGVARVHGDEEGAHAAQLHLVGVAGESEEVGASLLGVLDGQHLLRHHGQYGQLDAVELVEAAPQAAGAQALEDLGAVVLGHLAGAVGDDDVDAQRAAQVLHRLRLARAGGAGGRAAEVHAQRLGQRDVAAVGERRDDQALLDA